jgi:hypothetical protein
MLRSFVEIISVQEMARADVSAKALGTDRKEGDEIELPEISVRRGGLRYPTPEERMAYRDSEAYRKFKEAMEAARELTDGLYYERTWWCRTHQMVSAVRLHQGAGCVTVAAHLRVTRVDDIQLEDEEEERI